MSDTKIEHYDPKTDGPIEDTLNKVIDAVNKQRHDFTLLVDALHSDKPVQHQDTCPECGGNGIILIKNTLDGRAPCSGCEGSGRTKISHRAEVSCFACNGTGKKTDQ